jgi:phosphatidylglycerophosphatase A
LTTLARLIATWFYCGLAPVAPGTVGSIAAIAIAWALNRYFGVSLLAIAGFGVLLAVPGIWAAGVTAKSSGNKDPQIVVVDEVVGQWITLAGGAFANAYVDQWPDWKLWLVALVLFRIFDVWKPPPVRQLERLPGGLGIVADDAMAGVYAAVILYALCRLPF